MKKAILYGALGAVIVVFAYNKSAMLRQALGGPA